MNKPLLQRNDHKLIADWIPEKSRVLDLGCGNGSLLELLQTTKSVNGYGLELNASSIPSCIEKGVNVIQMNLDKGLTGFEDKSFDFVMLSLTLQSVKHPDELLNEMLRVGETGIVSFPNFGFLNTRSQLMFEGKMPVSKVLPHQWFDTPNIHLCTVKDFERYCKNNGIEIIDSLFLNRKRAVGSLATAIPNLFASVALYKIKRS